MRWREILHSRGRRISGRKSRAAVPDFSSQALAEKIFAASLIVTMMRGSPSFSA